MDPDEILAELIAQNEQTIAQITRVINESEIKERTTTVYDSDIILNTIDGSATVDTDDPDLLEVHELVGSGTKGAAESSPPPGSPLQFGTNGPEFLVGSSLEDFVSAGGGNDTVDGGPGDDSLFGGGGTDYLKISSTGPVTHTVVRGIPDGNEYDIAGSSSTFVLDGFDDIFFGVIVEDELADLLLSGDDPESAGLVPVEQDDFISFEHFFGTDGHDFVDTDARSGENDTAVYGFQGGEGVDTYALTINEDFVKNPAKHIVDGGPNAVFTSFAPSSSGSPFQPKDGIGDRFILNLDGAVSGFTVGVTEVEGTVVVYLDDGLFEVDPVTFEVVSTATTIAQLSNIEEIIINGSEFADSIFIDDSLSSAGVSEKTIHINGRGGDDIIDASQSTDRVRIVADGGEGDDTIAGGPGDDIIIGGPGRDTKTGGRGIDTHRGDAEDFHEDIITDLTAGESLELIDHLGETTLGEDGTVSLDTDDDGIAETVIQLFDPGVIADLARFEFDRQENGDDLHIDLAGANLVLGTEENDTLDGTDGEDVVEAFAGDDLILGSAGFDLIDGGEGLDTVRYDGDSAAFSPVIASNGFVEFRGPDASEDVLINVERVEVTDGVFLYDIAGIGAEFLYALYEIGLDRRPDELGFRFWWNDLAASGLVTREEVAQSFIDSIEFEAVNGSALSDAEWLDTIVANADDGLQGPVDPDLLLDALSRGVVDRAEALVILAREEARASAEEFDNGIFVVSPMQIDDPLA
ncbi:MAG: DUF4214 domain-containing protein [Pseudomonadota bacterium]